MNVNQLLYDHQLAKLNAQRSRCAGERDACIERVGRYAKQIMAWRRAEGLVETGWPSDERALKVRQI